LTLLKLGIDQKVVDAALLETLSQSLSTNLDWMCLKMGSDQLPAFLASNYMLDDSTDSKISLIKNQHHPPSPAARSISAPIPQIIKKEQINDQQDIKNWIMARYAAGGNQEQEEQEQEEQPTNIKYAELKVKQANLKQSLTEAKESGNMALISDISEQMKSLKLEMQDVAKARDYNPMLANKEFARIMQEIAEKKKEKKTNEEEPTEEDPDFLANMFDSTEGCKPTTKSTSHIILDLSYTKKQWTGKSPKQFFNDWLSKNAKGTKAAFSVLGNSSENNGFRCKVVLKGGHKDFDGKEAAMEPQERCSTLKDAEHYAATKLLYQLNSHLPLYRSLPPPYRDLWLHMEADQHSSQQDAQKKVDDERRAFLNQLVRLRDEKLKHRRVKEDSVSGNTHVKEEGPHGVKPSTDKRISDSMKTQFESRKLTESYKTILVGSFLVLIKY
jgi:ATP-dependent RNA helicase DHX29